MKKFVLSIISFLLFQALIIKFAVSTFNTKIPAFILSGPLAHFSAFFITSFLLALVLTHEFIRLKHPFALSFVYSLLFATGIELVQSTIAYRTASVGDIVVGVFGSATFCILFAYLSKNNKLVHKLFY